MLALPQCFNKLPTATLQLLAQYERLKKIEQILSKEKRLPKHGYRAIAIRPIRSTSLMGKTQSHLGDCLTLMADHPMLATRLKNFTPTILQALKGYDISDISIKIKGKNISKCSIFVALPIIPPRPIPAKVVNKLLKSAPNTALGDVLQKMVDSALIEGKLD